MNPIAQALASCRRVRIGDTLHIHDPRVPGLDRKIDLALRNGETVVENGVSRWITEFTLIDSSRDGSNRYTWDKTGNRVRVERRLNVRSNGQTTTTVIGLAWRKFSDL